MLFMSTSSNNSFSSTDFTKISQCTSEIVEEIKLVSIHCEVHSCHDELLPYCHGNADLNEDRSEILRQMLSNLDTQYPKLNRR